MKPIALLTEGIWEWYSCVCIMLHIKNILILTALSALLFLSLTKIAKADFCNPIYGGGPTCITIGGLMLDATVMNPETNKMVNGLKINDPKYIPGSIVTFQIKLINTTNSTIGRIDVQHGFPPYVNYSAGEGNFDQATRILSFTVNSLEPNKPKTYNVFGRIAESDQIPGGNGTTCVTSQAVAVVVDPASAKDTLSLCIEKKIAPTPLPIKKPATKSGFPILTPPAAISKTPATGNEALFTLVLIPIGILGEFLRRKSKQ